MRKSAFWFVLIALFVAAGCTSNVHPAVREKDTNQPTADTGVIAQGTTGGDAAGTLNLHEDGGEKAAKAKGNDTFGG